MEARYFMIGKIPPRAWLEPGTAKSAGQRLAGLTTNQGINDNDFTITSLVTIPAIRV